MVMPIPARLFEVDPFEYTWFASGRAYGHPAQKPQWCAHRHYPAGPTTWSTYVTDHLQYAATAIVDKDDLFNPALVHGRSDGFRCNVGITSCTALLLDCDDPRPEPDLTLLNGVRYLYQARPVAGGWKFHLVLPLAETMVVSETAFAPEQISARREAAIAWFSEALDRRLDEKLAGLAWVLHPYCRRSATDSVPKTVVGEGALLDLEALLASTGFVDRARRGPKRTGPTPDAAALSAAVLEALKDRFLDSPRRPAGRPIACPFDHSGQSQSSTCVTDTGLIVCLHDGCHNRVQAEYWVRLGLPLGKFALEVQTQLAAAQSVKVTVPEAADRIAEALDAARPYERTATVVQVTTGAGKTRAVTSFLNRYCAPTEDGPGRSAVLALPTNRLLREVLARIQVPHRVQVGVLAVLNDDGTPACKKHEEAARLQKSGGDVHRLMCSGCEYREGCPARDGASTGDGALTVTNQALLPSVVKTLQESGRLPLVVWDECPELVSVTALRFADLSWALDRFEEEDRPGPILARWDRPPVFGEGYRVCLRPLVEVLQRLRFQSLTDAVEEYGRTRLSESQLARAEALLGLTVPVTGTWARIQRVAALGRRVNVSDSTFDHMTSVQQETVLRAEKVCSQLKPLLEPDVVTEKVLGGIQVTVLTASGRLWRDHGGVVLDATAPVAELQALRSDLVSVRLAVADAGVVRRLLKPQPGLARCHFKRYSKNRQSAVIETVVGDLSREVRRLERRLGRPPKTAVFSYRHYLELLQAKWDGPGAVEWGYYGNTRGYDRWFQEGFDCFVTIGDPYQNIGADLATATYLKLPEPDGFSASRARAEAAQAHGRSRAPQPKLVAGERLHVHYGRLAPSGWDAENTMIDRKYGGQDEET